MTRADGLQVEFVLGNEDENGVVPYGYEDRTVSEFRAKVGKDPFDLPNNDPDWMQFRADYVTLFLSEVRARIKAVLTPGGSFDHHHRRGAGGLHQGVAGLAGVDREGSAG